MLKLRPLRNLLPKLKLNVDGLMVPAIIIAAGLGTLAVVLL